MARFREMRYRGIPISGGAAVGRVCLFNDWRHTNLPQYKVAGDGIARERARLENAIRRAAEHLAGLVDQVTDRVGAAQASIFGAQKMMIEDEILHAQMFERIEQGGMNAESVVAMSFDAYEFMLNQMGADYLRERASDISEVKRRLLNVLNEMAPSLQCGDQAHCQRGRDRIIVAEELTPTLTMLLDADRTLGFVTEHGGVASHAAILARALGIPAVSGIANIHSELACGAEVLVNGDTGEVFLWPSEDTVGLHPAAGHTEPVEIVSPVPGLAILANINRAEETNAARACHAEGVGLYRTEFECLAEGRILTEDEQFERYSAVIKAMDGKPVTCRLFDIGGDKAAAFLGLPPEDNPQLGLRGGRLLAAYPDLLASQARALARASCSGPVNILYPMIADTGQFVALRTQFLKAIEGVSHGAMAHGVMFEVPSLCLSAREVFEEAEFGSIGTNDLTQYLFAVDRNNELVAGDYPPDHPVLWRLIESMAQAALAARRPLSVCGEIAGEPAHLLRLIELGITTVSMTPRLIPEARRGILHSRAAPVH